MVRGTDCIATRSAGLFYAVPGKRLQSVGNRIKSSPETLYHHRLRQILRWCQWVSTIYCGAFISRKDVFSYCIYPTNRCTLKE